MLCPGLAEPALALPVTEHDHVPAVRGHQLEVVATDRASGPPSILDHPLLPDRLHRSFSHHDRHTVRPRANLYRARAVEAARHSSGNGVSKARRSGIRDCRSTSSTRTSASPPAVARV